MLPCYWKVNWLLFTVASPLVRCCFSLDMFAFREHALVSRAHVTMLLFSRHVTGTFLVLLTICHFVYSTYTFYHCYWKVNWLLFAVASPLGPCSLQLANGYGWAIYSCHLLCRTTEPHLLHGVYSGHFLVVFSSGHFLIGPPRFSRKPFFDRAALN